MARLSVPVGALYASTKGALETLTRAWAAEFGPKGARVNAVSPGGIADPELNLDHPAYALMHGTPAGRAGEPATVPQRAILEQADAFVTHAGMGGCCEGLLAGVPMIAVPQAADQFMNADRLVELGVARRVDTAQATAGVLRAALCELVGDARVARRSALLRAEARAEGGTRRAADLLEGMLP